MSGNGGVPYFAFYREPAFPRYYAGFIVLLVIFLTLHGLRRELIYNLNILVFSLFVEIQ